MLSTPTPHLAIILSFFAFNKISFVNLVALRITMISESLMYLMRSLLLEGELDISVQSPISLSSSKTCKFKLSQINIFISCHSI